MLRLLKGLGFKKNCPGGLKSNESISLGPNCCHGWKKRTKLPQDKKEQITALIIVLSFVREQSLKESESPAVPGLDLGFPENCSS